MEYDSGDAVSLCIEAGCTFSSAGHYPLIAGNSAAGVPFYCAQLSETRCFEIAIQSDVRPEEIGLKLYNADGSITIIKPQYFGQSMLIEALRYDPHAYELSEYYSSRKEEANCMDATGPFSWKFHRKLPDIQPREKLSCGEASIRAPEILWLEAFTELNDEERICDDSSVLSSEDDSMDDSMDVVMSEEKAARNEQKITSLLDKY